MKCPKCYAETFASKLPIELPILINALEEFYHLGVFHYVMQGGEAITDPDRLEAILLHCYPDETYINVVSNGWGVTRKKIRWLRDLKVDKIAFSMDSGIEDEHDSGRLNGSFKWVTSAIENVLAEGLLTSISVVVTHQSLYSDGFKQALEFAKSRKIRVDVQIAEPVGKWDGRSDILITKTDAAYIKSLQRELGTLPNGQYMINRDIYTGVADHCPAGTEFMGLSTDGELLPCNFLQFSLGNIRDFSVREMRKALLASPWFNGCHPDCLCGENSEFIEKYISPNRLAMKPLDAYQMFGINRPSQRRIQSN
jgi:MoaA/NifB/PqqE/SkfB family radical SAM enzyme